MFVDGFNELKEVNSQMEALAELKEYLKVFIQEKENVYRIKIEKKLYGNNYQPAKERTSSDLRKSEGMNMKKRK